MADDKDDKKMFPNPGNFLDPSAGWNEPLSIMGSDWFAEKPSVAKPVAGAITPDIRKENLPKSLPVPLPIAKLGADGRYHAVQPPAAPSQNAEAPHLALNAAQKAVEAVKAIPAEVKDAAVSTGAVLDKVGTKVESGLDKIGKAFDRLPKLPSVVGGVTVKIGETNNYYTSPPVNQTEKSRDFTGGSTNDSSPPSVPRKPKGNER